jgi:hypothetical protein
VAVRSSSAKRNSGVPGSTTDAFFGTSTSTVEVGKISRALAAGSKVATKNREEEMPRMATDLANFDFDFMP